MNIYLKIAIGAWADFAFFWAMAGSFMFANDGPTFLFFIKITCVCFAVMILFGAIGMYLESKT